MGWCSPSLGLYRHGATQGFGGELHANGLDGGQVPGDLVHRPLDGAGDRGEEPLALFLHRRVCGPTTAKPDTQLGWGEDRQGQSVPLGEELVLPAAMLHHAQPEDSRGAGLPQGAELPLPVHCLLAGVILHVLSLPVWGSQESLG